MAGVNKAIIVGRLGRDPEMRYTQDGSAVANFSVATSETWNDKMTGEKRERTEWHRIVAFRRLAEICGQYLSKGKQVYIEGRIQTRDWEDKDGNKRYTTEIVANIMQMLGSPQDSGHQGGGGYGPGQQGGGGYGPGQQGGGFQGGGGYGPGQQGGGFQGGGGYGPGQQGGGFQGGGGYGPGQQGGGFQGGGGYGPGPQGGGFQGGGGYGPGQQGGGFQQAPQPPSYEAPQQEPDSFGGDYQPEPAAPAPGTDGESSSAVSDEKPPVSAGSEPKPDAYEPPSGSAGPKDDVKDDNETDDDIPF